MKTRNIAATIETGRTKPNLAGVEIQNARAASTPKITNRIMAPTVFPVDVPLSLIEKDERKRPIDPLLTGAKKAINEMNGITKKNRINLLRSVTFRKNTFLDMHMYDIKTIGKIV